MKKYLLPCLLAIVFILSSCSPDAFGPKPQPISDSRFNGSFSYYESKEGWTSNDGYRYESYTFDGTSKASYYSKYWYWSDYSGWHISGDFKGDYYLWDYEIEVNDTHTAFRQRLWNNRYSSWSEWMPYEFSADGSELKICQFPSEFPDSYEYYTKR